MSDLPESWVEVPIGSVARIVGGGTPPSKDPQNFVEPGKGIPWVTPADLSGYRKQLIERGARDLTEAGYAACGATLMPQGTVLFSSRAPIGYVAIAANEISTNQGFKSFVLPPEIDARYTYYQLKWLKPEAEAIATGTTFKELSGSATATLPFKLAPAAEQTRIANQLDTLLTRIQSCNDRFDAIPTLLKRFRQAVCAAATTGPWAPSTIGAISVDLRYGTSKKCDYIPTGTGVLRIPNIAEQGRIDVTDLKRADFDASELQKLALMEGDLLVIRSNGSVELVGKTGLVTEKESGLLFAGYLIRLRVDRTMAVPAFIQLCLSAPLQREYIERTAKSTSGVNNLNAEELRSLPLLLPSLSEQIEIVRRAKALFALADRIEARATAARTQAQRLSPLVLAKAFRGELVQQDPQDEPASVLLQRLVAAMPAKAKASRGRPRTKTQELFATPEGVRPDAAGLPDGVWAAPEAVDEHAVTAMLVAVLKAWGGPMPQMQARLAVVLCLQPRQMTAVMPAEQAAQWQRLVGPLADPLPTQVARLQPATDSAWRKALLGMRARGDLVEEGSGPQAAWALGPGADQMETTGWPQGRADWVVAYLRAQGAEAILPLLEPLTVEFVHARAA